MNGTEQKEHKRAVDALDKRLRDVECITENLFHGGILSVAAEATAAGMVQVRQGLKPQLDELRNSINSNQDVIWRRLDAQQEGIVSFVGMTFWGRLKWLIRGA